MLKTARLRERTRATRAAARIRRRGTGSLSTYAIAEGLRPSQAKSVSQTMRKEAKALWIDGEESRVHAGRQMRDGHRYTPDQIALIATMYQPRSLVYKEVAVALRNLGR